MLLMALPTAMIGAQTPAPAITGSLAGVVRDVSGTPLPDVNVTLLGEAGTARTDSAGHFTLRDVPPGKHTTLFRRLGYRSVEYRWTAQAGTSLQIAVAMTPVPRQLDRVVVEAPVTSRRRGTSSIAGSVTDSANHGVAGADLRLLGSGLATVTDSTGQFEFQMLAAGSYIVRARRHGLLSSTYVMQIADDDNRSITMKLYGLPASTNPRDSETASGYGTRDAGFEAFDRRERASGGGNPMLGPGDLFRADRASLDFLLQQYRDVNMLRARRSSLVEQGAGSTEAGDCILIDGRRSAYQPLRTFNTVDVQLVEVFRSNASVDEYIVSQMEAFKECRGSMDHHPSYFVLWTRSLR